MTRRFDSPLGLGRVGADDLDAELVEGAAQVRHAVAVGSRAVVPKGAVLVRIEGDRLAVPLEIGPCRPQVGEGALAFRHLEVHQLARGIVDIDQQAAAWPATLEPVMIRTVDLDELAPALAPVAGLVEPGAVGGLASHRPAPIISCRSVSCESVMPWRSARYSAASVGPKSA